MNDTSREAMCCHGARRMAYTTKSTINAILDTTRTPVVRRQNRILSLAVMSLLWGVATWAEPLHFYRYPLSHLGYYPHQAVSPSPKPYKKYGLVNIDTHDAGKSSPIVEDGIIYVGTDYGQRGVPIAVMGG